MSGRRICYFGTYRRDYPRNQILIEGLRRAGYEVLECHVPLWGGEADRVRVASGGWMRPAFIGRFIKAYWRLLARYWQTGEYDVLVIGYPGQIDVFLGWLLAGLRGKPLVWDVLNSLYLITLERGIRQRSRITVELIRLVERMACKLPDRMLLDTVQFVAWFAQTHGANPSRFRLVQIGADERLFQPLDNPIPNDPHEFFQVLYYGTYIPNHGVETIIEAARLLQTSASPTDQQVRIKMIGAGPELPKAKALAEKSSLGNVTFIDWLERPELSEHIAACDLILGAFGRTQQLLLTNNNKIYEGFAMRKAVLSARTPALPAVLEHGVHLYLCERGDAESLAQAIRALQADADMRQRLANNGYRAFHEHFTVTHIGAQLAAHIADLG
jgi:glycosyltransferase involved in cell wall biosynthesis